MGSARLHCSDATFPLSFAPLQETDGSGCSASRSRDGAQDRDPRPVGQDVQDDRRRHLRLRVPHALRWQQNHRLRPHL